MALMGANQVAASRRANTFDDPVQSGVESFHCETAPQVGGVSAPRCSMGAPA